MATIKELEIQVLDLTDKIRNLSTVVKSLSDSIDTLNTTSNKKLDQSLKSRSDTFNLEGAVRVEILNSVGTAVTRYLNNGSSNLIEPVIKDCFSANKDLIKANINKAIQEEFNDINVSDLLKEHFRTKLIRAIAGNIESVVTVSVAELRKDVRFNSELVIAIDNCIQEYKDKYK